MTVEQYLEWRAFDAIEPLDAAGVILKGLAGLARTEVRQVSNWMQQKQNMLHWFNLFGKKR